MPIFALPSPFQSPTMGVTPAQPKEEDLSVGVPSQTPLPLPSMAQIQALKIASRVDRPAASCVILNICPATVIVPARFAPVPFGPALKFRVRTSVYTWFTEIPAEPL